LIYLVSHQPSARWSEVIMAIKFRKDTRANLAAATPDDETIILLTDSGNRGLAIGTGALGGQVIGDGAGAGWDGDIADINLVGGTDIGAALVDADLILVDDGATGTNRKSALSRVWTWIQTKFGTNVATALGVNVGTAGAFVVNGGALGTPASGTLTNCTGLPVSGITASTSSAIGVGTIELGHASDTTLARASAGVVSVEGVSLGRVIASGTAAMGTTSISSGASASAVTVSATGVATTDVITWGFNGTPNGVTGYNAASTTGGLVITAYPTANNVNFIVSNPTASSVTPGALTLNWRVVR
jgi:hypothetical protein